MTEKRAQVRRRVSSIPDKNLSQLTGCYVNADRQDARLPDKVTGNLYRVIDPHRSDFYEFKKSRKPTSELGFRLNAPRESERTNRRDS